MMSLKLISAITLIFTGAPLFGFSQQSAINCKDVKEGKFFAYPKYSDGHYTIIRKDNLQQEIDVSQGDTALWKVEWLTDCSYQLQFISGGKNAASLQALFKKHKTLVQIYAVTENYYTYRAYRDKVSDVETENDTLWIKDKPVDDRVFNKNDFEEASFPGGAKAWISYILGVVNDNMKALSRANKTGTCYVSFIVDTDGTVSNIEALTMEDTKLAKVSMDAIKDGPKWKPARLKGKPLKAYRIQPITFLLK